MPVQRMHHVKCFGNWKEENDGTGAFCCLACEKQIEWNCHELAPVLPHLVYRADSVVFIIDGIEVCPPTPFPSRTFWDFGHILNVFLSVLSASIVRLYFPQSIPLMPVINVNRIIVFPSIYCFNVSVISVSFSIVFPSMYCFCLSKQRQLYYCISFHVLLSFSVISVNCMIVFP